MHVFLGVLTRIPPPPPVSCNDPLSGLLSPVRTSTPKETLPLAQNPGFTVRTPTETHCSGSTVFHPTCIVREGNEKGKTRRRTVVFLFTYHYCYRVPCRPLTSPRGSDRSPPLLLSRCSPYYGRQAFVGIVTTKT